MKVAAGLLGILLLPIVAVPCAGLARDLTIGLATEATSIDPHFFNSAPNLTVSHHIFDGLSGEDANSRPVPQLATAWRSLDDTTWEFSLREGVTFHDGRPFTAADVVYSYCRVGKVENSPGPFTSYLKSIKAIRTPTSHTVVIETREPAPSLPLDLSQIKIIPAPSAASPSSVSPRVFTPEGCAGTDWPRTADFDGGRQAIGTGPFRLAAFAKGDRVALARFDGYWGDKPEWPSVTLKPIVDQGARVRALVGGSVDVIDKVGLDSLEFLEKIPSVTLVRGPSHRVIYLQLDHARAPTPGIEGTGGRNPLKDRRVREALSKAIDRDAITARVLFGLAGKAGQMTPPGLFGYDPDQPPEPHDPDRARKLLAEAGYPNGFALVIGAPNNRYVNDEPIARVIALMLGKVGIKATVDAMPKDVFFARMQKREFSIQLVGWGALDMADPLVHVLATPEAGQGFGPNNWGGYSNSRLDDLLRQALVTMDKAQRERLLQEASRVAMTDYALLPLHYEMSLWGLRKGLTYTSRMDQATLAMQVTSTR